MNEYEVEVEMKFSVILEARDGKDAIRKVKDDFVEQYNLEVKDEEITRVDQLYV